MTNHPLTDEMCKQIQLHIFNQNDEDCMRAAYDKGAADRLEQVIEWLEETECNQIFQGRVVFAEDLRKAMRPQEES